MLQTIPATTLQLDSCQAVVIHAAGQASLTELDLPPIGPIDLLIKVAYVGICRTDLEIMDGTLGYYQHAIAKYPIVPGHEVSGRIVAMGDEVVGLSVGDPVVVECIHGCGICLVCGQANPIGCPQRAELGVIHQNGGYAEYIVVQARFVHLVPAEIDLQQACLCEPLAVALKGLGRLERCWNVAPMPKNCAVVGAGPLGRLCAQVLAYRGHSVKVIDRDPRRLSGVDPSIRVSGGLERLEEFDAIVEATGEQPALETVLAASRGGANILLLGLPYSSAAFSFEQIVAYDKTVIGSVGSGAREFTAALSLLPSLDTSSFTQTVLPLREFAHGWELVRTHSHLKVLLTPGRA